jgi:hypothetical protein
MGMELFKTTFTPFFKREAGEKPKEKAITHSFGVAS